MKRLLLGCVLYRAIRSGQRESWYAIPAVLAIGGVLFASELGSLHVPRIWFPWGVGVSRSEFLSVIFDALLFALLVRRLSSYARLLPR